MNGNAYLHHKLNLKIETSHPSFNQAYKCQWTLVTRSKYKPIM